MTESLNVKARTASVAMTNHVTHENPGSAGSDTASSFSEALEAHSSIKAGLFDVGDDSHQKSALQGGLNSSVRLCDDANPGIFFGVSGATEFSTEPLASSVDFALCSFFLVNPPSVSRKYAFDDVHAGRIPIDGDFASTEALATDYTVSLGNIDGITEVVRRVNAAPISFLVADKEDGLILTQAQTLPLGNGLSHASRNNVIDLSSLAPLGEETFVQDPVLPDRIQGPPEDVRFGEVWRTLRDKMPMSIRLRVDLDDFGFVGATLKCSKSKFDVKLFSDRESVLQHWDSIAPELRRFVDSIWLQPPRGDVKGHSFLEASFSPGNAGFGDQQSSAERHSRTQEDPQSSAGESNNEVCNSVYNGSPLQRSVVAF